MFSFFFDFIEEEILKIENKVYNKAKNLKEILSSRLWEKTMEKIETTSLVSLKIYTNRQQVQIS